MLKLCGVAKVKMFFLVLVYVLNFYLFELSTAVLEKGLLSPRYCLLGAEESDLEVPSVSFDSVSVLFFSDFLMRSASNLDLRGTQRRFSQMLSGAVLGSSELCKALWANFGLRYKIVFSVGSF